jgi:hypothetical protein
MSPIWQRTISAFGVLVVTVAPIVTCAPAAA